MTARLGTAVSSIIATGTVFLGGHSWLGLHSIPLTSLLRTSVAFDRSPEQ
jgi:hypothetical protein